MFISWFVFLTCHLLSMKRCLTDSNTTGVYHCYTRAVAGAFLFKPQDLEAFSRILWKVADFCGVEILSFCFLSNHYHVLVKVPPHPDILSIENEELTRRYRMLYERSRTPGYPDADRMEEILLRKGPDASLWRARLLRRMSSLSEFMKTLNHRISICYNKRHARFGTLWAERFGSVVIEQESEIQAIVAAYIDLNPVRAGLVEDPSIYRWSGLGQAVGGIESARKAIMRITGKETWESAVTAYTRLLFGSTSGGRIRRAQVLEALMQGKQATIAMLIRCRVRYFTAGLALGSADFVRQIGDSIRSKEGFSSRKTPVKRLPLLDGLAVFSYRAPRMNRFS